MMIVAAPGYLARYGTPTTPKELLAHNRLGENYVRAQPGWPLRQGDENLMFPVTERPGQRRRGIAPVGLGRTWAGTFGSVPGA